MNKRNDVKKFIANKKCGLCGQRYEVANIDVLGHLGDLWLFNVYCSSCNSRGLISVNIKISEEPEAVTELPEAEKSYFSTPICFSDILNMHNFLNDFNGDFAALFAT